MQKNKSISILIFLTLFVFQPLAIAIVNPEQVAVLANKNLPESVELAQYYAKRRSIPKTNILDLPLPQEESISREDYEKQLILPLRKLLEKRNLADKIRVVLTTWGIPLKLSAPEAGDEEKEAVSFAQTNKLAAESKLQQILKELSQLAAKKSQELEQEKIEPIKTTAELAKRFQDQVREASKRIDALKDQTSANNERQKLINLIAQFGGLSLVLKNISPLASEAQKREYETLQEKLKLGQNLLQALNQTPSAVNRARLYNITAQVYGALGLLERTNIDNKLLTYTEATASLDSELSLLWWDREMYPVSGRMPNPHYHRLLAQAANSKLELPVLMVSRLDAASVKLAKGLVDQAISAEQHGLNGTVYIDARGLEATDDGYGLYDQNLRNLAWLFREETPYKVKLDNYDSRFSKPGDAPDVAAYVGWYQLRNYEDAFHFNPGAIGFHIASEEAVSIHNPEEKGWCKNALDRGITATLGPVGEPYVDAFPLPLEFFGLLLTGRYSLVEAYYRSSPYLSWQMVLFGDPLYNPWRSDIKDKGNFITGQELANKSDRAKSLAPLPTPIAEENNFPDPIQGREKLKIHQKNLSKQIEDFYKAAENGSKK